MMFNPLWYATLYSYNALNLPTQITTYPGGAQVNLSYDAHGNLLSLTEPEGNVTQFTYDAYGNLLTQVNALNQTTTFAYNAAHYPTSITEPNGAITTLTYDNAGNIVSVRDPLNNLYTLEYNGLNQIKRLTNPQNQVTLFSYDAKGNRTSQTDANGKVTQYSYNYNNRITAVTDALNHTTQLTYGSGCSSCGTGVDKLTSLTDARGQTTTFQYDLAGRLIRETSPLGYFKTNTYDAAGNILSRTDENNQTSQYTYDNLNRLTQIRYPNTTTADFGYDGRSNLISATNPQMSHSFSYDLNKRLTGQYDMYGKNVTYQYDGLNRRTQMTAPDGRVFTYSYNTGNRLSQIVAASRTYGFTHDLAGQRTGLTHPNGATTAYTYTPAGFLSSILARNSQQVTIDSFAYTHDALGRRTSLTDLAGLHTYQYDDTYQLTQATHPAPPTEQFSYDSVGNRLGTTVDLNNALLEDSEFTYTYDYNDNLIQKVKKANGEITSFTYDYENRLTRVQYPGMDAQYKYDALGRRIEKSVNGQVTTYVYDGLNMVTDYNGLWTVRSKYVFGLGLDEPLSVDQGGSLYYYHQDGLGSVNELTDASGNTVRTYRYDSFGKITNQTGGLDQPFTFTGREYDAETGLYYYRARYYDPKSGRFISKDPIGFEGGDVNLFRYVGNDPGNWVDPDGLQAVFPFPVPLPFPIIPVPPVQLTPHQWQDMRDFFNRPIESRGKSDPYKLPTVNPGKDACGKCNPCPPNSPVWEHTHEDGTVNRHQIVYNQNPNTCECKPTRIHL